MESENHRSFKEFSEIIKQYYLANQSDYDKKLWHKLNGVFFKF